MDRIALIIDQLGKGDNVFEQFAIEFEQIQLSGEIKPIYSKIQYKLEIIEQRLQDLSEEITVELENKVNIYSTTIQKTKELLSFWLTTFYRRNLNSLIEEKLVEELDSLIKYIQLKNIKNKSIEEVSNDFENTFMISLNTLDDIKNKIVKIDIDNFTVETLNEFSDKIVTFFISKIEKSENTASYKSLDINFELLDVPEKEEYILDSEDTIYSGVLNLWINTNDASEANRFMYIVSESLSKIENIRILIIDAGIGSYWQKLKIKINGWFGKEEVKQVLNKSGKALENYLTDRHIEPIEKSKTERKLLEGEIERMMDIDNVKLLEKINIEKAKEELESLKLSNIEKKIEITTKLSDLLTAGLITIDSDFRIELNGLLLIKKENGVISTGKIDEIDESLEKE